MDSIIPINADQNKTRMGTYPTQSVMHEYLNGDWTEKSVNLTPRRLVTNKKDEGGAITWRPRIAIKYIWVSKTATARDWSSQTWM